MAKKEAVKNKKFEFSKFLCLAMCVVFITLGSWMIAKYYNLIQMSIEINSSVMPDAALPIAGISFIFAPMMSYLLYQGGLKNSRNKYGIDADGQPYCIQGDDI